MIKSMTGYGDATYSDDNIELKVEVKSINSKNLDPSFNMPRWLSCYEIRWRKIIENILFRGKISICINLNLKIKTSLGLASLSKEAFILNYNTLKNLASDVSAQNTDLFRLALKYSYDDTSTNSIAEILQNEVLKTPEVIHKNSSEISKNITHNKRGDSPKSLLEDIVNKIQSKLKEATEKCDFTRQEEGEHIYKKFKEYIDIIEQERRNIHNLTSERIESIKSRIKTKLEMLKSSNKDSLNISYDTNRFEQELLYYIEKLDIEEEMVRLSKHLSLFSKTLSSYTHRDSSYSLSPATIKSTTCPCGKKLGFILQEINREANTIASKANNEHIQKSVVTIKEFIEKIKEQLFNVL